MKTQDQPDDLCIYIWISVMNISLPKQQRDRVQQCTSPLESLNNNKTKEEDSKATEEQEQEEQCSWVIFLAVVSKSWVIRESALLSIGHKQWWLDTPRVLLVDVEESENVRLVAHIGSDANAPESAVAISHLCKNIYFYKRSICTVWARILTCVLSR